MKLVFCRTCGDIFNLRLEQKECSCGSTIGMYTDNERAVVAGPHVAIAIGNGSFARALRDLPAVDDDWRKGPHAEDIIRLYEEMRKLVPTIVLTWVRHPTGKSNPHTT